jgi:serine-type D-Ala-D-Ala carboxypeptidase (penicillin-binding protein 5/6)
MRALGIALVLLVLLVIAAAVHQGQSRAPVPGPGQVAGESALVMDQDTGAILFGKAADEPKYPASTTKVLTALVALEACDLNERVFVGAEADNAAPDSSRAGLQYGEVLSVRELLYAMLIPSGSDAAYVLAVHVGRRVAQAPDLAADDALRFFAELMNARARKAGAGHSHFVNPDGYQQVTQVSTATDLALIARAAMAYPAFRAIVSTRTYRLPSSGGNRGPERPILTNTNQLLDPGSPFYCSQASGIKTGHTSEAGYCLISSGSNGRKRLITVVMCSPEPYVWGDSKRLLEWGLEQG